VIKKKVNIKNKRLIVFLKMESVINVEQKRLYTAVLLLNLNELLVCKYFKYFSLTKLILCKNNFKLTEKIFASSV